MKGMVNVQRQSTHFPATAAILLTAIVSCRVGAAPPPPSHAAHIAGPLRLTLSRVERRPPLSRVNLWFRVTGTPPEAIDRLVERAPQTLPSTAGSGTWTLIDSTGRRGTATHRIEREADGLFLVVQSESLAAGAIGLRELRGALTLYPDARRIRFHLPWDKDNLPATVQVEGGTATLRRFQLIESDATVWVGLGGPEGFRMAEGPGAVSAVLADLYGNLVNGGGITDIQRVQASESAPAERNAPKALFRMQAPALRRTPSRLTVDVLFARGAPVRVPVSIKGLKFSH